MSKSIQKSILLIESDESVLSSLQEKLKIAGYLVISAKDGFEGYERVKSENPSIIISELALPVMSGAKVARLLKYDERYKEIPFILLGSDNALSKINKEEYNIEKVLPKPFRLGDLKDAIETLLG
ncbi:MAG: response regulator [Candidatus Marinimicrobia bacterium]|jgi:CheY-like chemotaxis protein|nr:response regulator [Candidatus Neomarinimicrobiota bacterium]MDA8752949.1 response regulator [Candidatus Neomarinimicrobiota bacterium]MDA9656746.1 response regulator [Candidatus Neomarinimicrobiota bacterium]